MLYTEEEAGLISLLPIRPFTAKKAAKVWQVSLLEAEKRLDRLCEKALLVDSLHGGERQFVMPPPMAGFFEFALMRVRGDLDQKYLSQLYDQYMNVEEDFVKDLFYATETKLGRVYVQEPVLTGENALHILDYERAGYILEEAEHIGLGLCYCRHKALHNDRPCEIGAPLDVCLTLGNVARSLAENGGHARLIDKIEAREVLERSYAANLVQIGENVRQDPAFICNCCGCCCEALQAARRFSPMQPVATTNYLPEVDLDRCVSCGKCVKVCPILAVSLEEDGEAGGAPGAGPAGNHQVSGTRREAGTGETYGNRNPAENQETSGTPEAAENRQMGKRQKKLPRIDKEICLGCGVCARNCPTKAIVLKRRPIQVVTPVNSTHRFVLQAIEKGTLQNLIFDQQAFANHRAMAAVFGVILKLPPLKQAMACRQFKSVYLDRLLARQGKKDREKKVQAPPGEKLP